MPHTRGLGTQGNQKKIVAELQLKYRKENKTSPNNARQRESRGAKYGHACMYVWCM